MHVNTPMDPDFFVCCICKYEYNQTTNIPKMLPMCGHTFCLECMTKMRGIQNHIRCPLDQGLYYLINQDVNLLPTNILIKQMAEFRTRMKGDLCDNHEGELKNLVCLTDSCKVCKYCVDYGVHSTHDVRYIKDIEAEAEMKKDQLQDMLKDYDVCLTQMDKLVSSEKLSMLRIVLTSFEELKRALEKQKLQMLNKINILFDQKKDGRIFPDSYKEKQRIKESYQQSVEILNCHKMDQEYFTALNEDYFPI